MQEKIHITLTYPTVFLDLNKKENKEETFAREVIEIERMRFGHIKEMQAISPEKQTNWVIQKLTGLSENDMDQLFAQDAAEITKTVFGFMEPYFGLAKKMWNNPEVEKQ
jgi:hypothetical protein